MSTILNTLKKLEEEKSVLDRSLNLKGLVLQTDRALYPRVERERISPLKALVALIVGGIVVGIGLGIYLNPVEKTPNTAPKAPTPPVEKSEPASSALTSSLISSIPAAAASAETAPATPVSAKPRDMATGIPLASIQDAGTVKPAPAPAPAQPKKVVPPPSAMRPAEPQPIPGEIKEDVVEPVNISMELLPDFHEINAILDDAKLKKIQAPSPRETKNYGAISIPAIKMKGIIYFSEKNPANYVLISGTQDTPQRKLKIGESIQDATLMEVLPSSAVFSYKGELAQMRIGE